MNDPDLLFVCVAALAAVFLLLGVLAGTMRGLTALFPASAEGDDTALVAAIAAAAAAAHPGRRVTRIEEIR